MESRRWGTNHLGPERTNFVNKNQMPSTSDVINGLQAVCCNQGMTKTQQLYFGVDVDGVGSGEEKFLFFSFSF